MALAVLYLWNKIFAISHQMCFHFFSIVWFYFGVIGSFIFIIIQLILLIDFAHSWNKRWVENAENGNKKCWFAGTAWMSLWISPFLHWPNVPIEIISILCSCHNKVFVVLCWCDLQACCPLPFSTMHWPLLLWCFFIFTIRSLTTARSTRFSSASTSSSASSFLWSPSYPKSR